MSILALLRKRVIKRHVGHLWRELRQSLNTTAANLSTILGTIPRNDVTNINFGYTVPPGSMADLGR